MSNDWIVLVDPQTTKPFYANVKTGSCTWKKPKGTSFDGDTGYNVEWWELYDKKHEMPYYYNTKTKFTDWIRPKGVEIVSLIKLQQQTILKNVSRNSIIKNEAKNEDNIENESPNQYNLLFTDNPEYSIIIDNSLSRNNVSQVNYNDSPGGYSPILPVSMKFEHYKRLSAEILNHIKNYGIDEYAKKNFMEHRKGIFRKKIPVESLLSWSKQSLRKPLLKSSRNYYKDALRCFSLIQCIIGDKNSNNKLNDVQKLIEIGLKNAGIRDEIYCQVCKQLNKNPNFNHIVLGWKLMSVLVVAFPPSRDFEEYLKCFIEKHTRTNWSSHLIHEVIGNTKSKKSNLKRSMTHPYRASSVIVAADRDIKEFNEKYLKEGEEGKKEKKEEERKNGKKDDNKNTNDSSSSGRERQEDDERIKTIQILSQHCYRKLSRTCIIGPRGKPLSLKEIEQRMNAAFNFSYFGETLGDIMEQQKKERGSELEIPEIMIFLADSILNLNGTQTEGIFRVPGDADAISELRYQVEKRNFNLNGCTDPNVPASLLKLWLRELAEPLIPTYAYNECIEIGKKENDKTISVEAWKLIESLPEINRLVITYMTDFLKVIAKPENQHFTKMTVANLAMVFAPNFLRCPSDNPQIIFENTKYEQAFIRILISN